MQGQLDAINPHPNLGKRNIPPPIREHCSTRRGHQAAIRDRQPCRAWEHQYGQGAVGGQIAGIRGFGPRAWECPTKHRRPSSSSQAVRSESFSEDIARPEELEECSYYLRSHRWSGWSVATYRRGQILSKEDFGVCAFCANKEDWTDLNKCR